MVGLAGTALERTQDRDAAGEYAISTACALRNSVKLISGGLFCGHLELWSLSSPPQERRKPGHSKRGNAK